MDKFQFDIHKL